MGSQLLSSHRREIEDCFAGEIVQVETLSGGCVGEVYGVHLADGTNLVAKCDPSSSGALLDEGKLCSFISACLAAPTFRSWTRLCAGSACRQQTPSRAFPQMNSNPLACGLHPPAILRNDRRPCPQTHRDAASP